MASGLWLPFTRTPRRAPALCPWLPGGFSPCGFVINRAEGAHCPPGRKRYRRTHDIPSSLQPLVSSKGEKEERKSLRKHEGDGGSASGGLRWGAEGMPWPPRSTPWSPSALPTSWPWHILFPVPGAPLAQPGRQPGSLTSSGLCQNVTFPQRPLKTR